jgi:uncharacterized protein YhjY with autotransporter beta-barrel domain
MTKRQQPAADRRDNRTIGAFRATIQRLVLLCWLTLTGTLLAAPAAQAQTVLTNTANNLSLITGQAFSATYRGVYAGSTFTVIGTLPPGIVATPGPGTLTIAGTPTSAGDFAFSVRVNTPVGFTFVPTPVTSPFAVTVAGPAALANASLSVPYTTSGTIDLAGSATGTVLTGLTFAIIKPPSHGTATLVGSRVTYTPAAGYSGADSLAFNATTIAGTSAPAQLLISVGVPPDPTGSGGVRAARDAGLAAVRHLQDAQGRNYETRLDDLARLDSCTGAAAWAGGLAARGSADGSAGFDFNTRGLTVGADGCLGGVSIGFGAGHGQDRSDFAGATGSSKATATSGAHYGSFRLLPGWRLNWMVGFGQIGFDYDRLVPETGGTAHGHWTARQWQSSLSTRVDRHFRDWRLAPFVRLDAATASRDAFVERADTAYALRYDSEQIKKSAATLGLLAEYTHEAEWGKLVPRLRVEYQHDFASRSRTTLAYDAQPGTVYELAEESGDRRQTTVLLGTDVFLRNGFSFAIHASRQQGDGMHSNAVHLHAVQKF